MAKSFIWQIAKNKHIGSTFESFLEEVGILEEVNAAVVKKVIIFWFLI